MSAKFQKCFLPSYIIFRILILEDSRVNSDEETCYHMQSYENAPVHSVLVHFLKFLVYNNYMCIFQFKIIFEFTTVHTQDTAESAHITTRPHGGKLFIAALRLLFWGISIVVTELLS